MHQLDDLNRKTDRVKLKIADCYDKLGPQVGKLNKNIFLMKDYERQKIVEDKGMLYHPGQENSAANEVDRLEKNNPRFYKKKFNQPKFDYTSRDLRKEMKEIQSKYRDSEDMLKNTRIKDSVPDKKTYPMCIAVFEELNLMIFAMVNKQIAIMEIKQAG